MLGAVFISQSGVILNSMESAGLWQVQFYRAMVAIITLFALLLVKHRGRVLRAFVTGKRAMLSTGIFLAISNLFYVSSFFYTKAASVFFIVSAQPFFTALLAWIVLREPVRKTTWLAMIAAMAGVGVMMGEGVIEGRLFGNLLALGAAISFAGFGVSLRKGRDSDMVPGVMLAAIIIGLLAAFLLDDFSISDHDLMLCIYMGVFQVSFALVLYAAGAKYVPAAELMVLGLTEVIMGPFWVWLFIGETPSMLGFIGGGILMGAVFVNALTGMRRARG